MQKFYICNHCKNLIGMIDNKGVPLVCCGEKMTELNANTSDAAKEKHVPVVIMAENGMIKVEVGSVFHPMAEDHNIEFIYVETKKGGQRKALATDEDPVATFSFYDDEPVAVYAYCNLHGLWKTTL